MFIDKRYIKYKYRNVISPAGFSLIELLVALALTGIVMSGVYAVYIANIKAVAVDEQRVEIQQGQRFAIDFMMRELRHAGYDLAETEVPTIVEAGSDYIYFTADLYGCDEPGCTPSTASSNDPFADGSLNDPGEHVVFCIYDNKLGYFSTDTAADVGVLDSDNDGFVDSGHSHAGNNHQEISKIENIEFYYTLSDGTRTTTPSDDELDDIRAVDISLLSRHERNDATYKPGAKTYTTSSGTDWVHDDGYRRMLMTTTVRFRNMGL